MTDGIEYMNALVDRQRRRIAELEKELELARSGLDSLLAARSIASKSEREEQARPLKDRFPSFSGFLRTFLKEENMSQSDFASLLGLSSAAVSRWLGGGGSKHAEHGSDDERHMPAEAAVAYAGGS